MKLYNDVIMHFEVMRKVSFLSIFIISTLSFYTESSKWATNQASKTIKLNYFFTQCENKDFYICNNEKCSAKIKQKLNLGYTNHVKKCTGKDYLEIYNEVCNTCKSEEDK